MDNYRKSSLAQDGNILKIVQDATLDQKPLLELTEEQREQLKSAAGIALSVIAAAGVIAVAAVAPNVFQAVGQIQKLTKKPRLAYREKQGKTAQTFYYLKRYGLIQLEPGLKGLLARLTDKGKKRMEKLSFETLQVSKRQKWDGNWWLVAADIPTKHYRWAADLFRKKIKRMGFCPLQRTMWFFPYNPAREIEFLSLYYGIGQFVTVMQVNKLDKDDEWKLKEYFNIKR